ncbi:hypothetical protein LZC95_20235 [Pendulispora brunnea]|uniref:Uncharacterized protein n=1 Tax=Pendulispora brunnea TaxID=2905690 RepID=A0ABZ2KKF5_9BACT
MFGDSAAEALAWILSAKNGFYAFSNALHVHSDTDTDEGVSVYEWNDPDGWQRSYGSLAPAGVCFAEDVFGNQFVWHDNGILTFDAESGRQEAFAFTLEQWAERLCQDPNRWTGRSVAMAWQEERGALPRGYRLVPKVPFVRGREIPTAHLDIVPAAEAMKTRGARALALYARGPRR